jgi:hypothetical protein
LIRLIGRTVFVRITLAHGDTVAPIQRTRGCVAAPRMVS